MMTDPALRPSLPARLFWTAVLAFHATAAAMWWWLMPGGFPLSHPRYWANRGAPAVVLFVVAAAVVARWRRRADVFAALALAVSIAWLAAAVATRMTFPLSRPLVTLAGVAGGLTLLAAWLVTPWRRGGGPQLGLHLAAPLAVVATLAGLILPHTQRAAPPSTRLLPASPPAPELLVDDPQDRSDLRAVRFSDSLMAQPADGVVTLRHGRVMMTVQPLLTFISRSPDGFWTIFARREDRVGPPRELRARLHDATGATFVYHDDGRTVLRVEPLPGDGSATIDATTTLSAAVYSHLNTYAEVGLYGHRDLSLTFSACPDERIEVTYSQYPVGRPQRCAYLDAGGTFRVVEASSGEKGPFKPLASGPLARGEPLVITLYDAGAPLCRITLDDWSAQAGTDLSPTAGWGLPVNAIEFSRYGEAPSSPVGISMTLAGTSVGRGWDSVGHAAGTYRNRMRVEALLPTEVDPRKE